MVPTAMCSKTGKVPSWGGDCGDAGVAGRGENSLAVVPEVERLRDTAVHVDVAVAALATSAGDRVGDWRGPHFRAGEAVGGEAVVVLEHHHGSTDSQVLGRANKRQVAVAFPPKDDICARGRRRLLRLV
jgi:hypothetical protein